MAEGHVSIGGQTFPMPSPFLVMATQNPIESESASTNSRRPGDRFLFKLVVDYPSPRRSARSSTGWAPPHRRPRRSSTWTPDASAGAVREVFVHHALVDYVVRVTMATRDPAGHGLEDVARWLSYGASPRATLGTVTAARALALVRGRDYVVPQDIVDVLPSVLRHRLVLTYDALADEVTPDTVVRRLLEAVPLPQISAVPVQTGPTPSR